MNAPERIWANEGLEWHSFDCSPVKSGWTYSYILATPEALAASPEVQALVDAAVKAERERIEKAVRKIPATFSAKGKGSAFDAVAFRADVLAAIRAGEGAT